MRTKVMVVDDSTMARQLVIRALDWSEFEVIEASDGVDALEKLARLHPTLIVLDQNMPRMTGLELLEKMHETAGGCPPVIMLTAGGHAEGLQRATELGATWLRKPVRPEVLVSVVKKILAHAATG